MATPEVCSFYGPDGCGKSTIAHSFTTVMQEYGDDYITLGGSSYKQWLTPDVAKNTLGHDHHLGDTPESPEEYARLCEDIAIACYGLARQLREEGKGVAIDSDPWLKRIIWSRIENTSPDSQQTYAEHFESRMHDHLGEAAGPDTVIGVNVQNDISAGDILRRLEARETNSDHDPTEIEEMHRLMKVVGHVWQQVERAIDHNNVSIPGLSRRLENSRKIVIANPSCEEQLIGPQAELLARELAQEVREAQQ